MTTPGSVPLCATCGSPLRPGAKFCRACGAQARAAQSAPPVGSVQQVPVAAPPKKPSTAVVPVILAGIAGVAIFAVIAATRSKSPNHAAPTPSAATILVAASYPDLGFAVSFPTGWEQSRRSVGDGREAVLFRDPQSGPVDGPARAFDVITEPTSYADALANVEATMRKQFPDYQKVSIAPVTVAGHRAFRHHFTASGLRFDQWWIERGAGTFRFTSWAASDNAGAQAVDDQIIQTFRVL